MKTIDQYPKPTKHGPECGEFNGAKIFEYLDCTDGQRYFYAAVLAPDESYCDVDGSEIVLDPGIIYRPE
ncbi:hypothetical protein [Terasakiella pusilla]|uniref:hypothetical protein n=1 Tax=Terasakiella pusilla TaxID=64973 RepID=UPI00048FC69A|nr:hypothetical protein [Terasakiella pusilla]